METKDKLDKLMIDIKAEQKHFSEIPDDQKLENYEKLLESYNKSVNKLFNFITEQQSTDNTRIPTKNELESIEMMLDIINKIDYPTLDKLNRFGGKAKS